MWSYGCIFLVGRFHFLVVLAITVKNLFLAVCQGYTRRVGTFNWVRLPRHLPGCLDLNYVYFFGCSGSFFMV